MALLIHNLAGVFTGAGFVKKQGRQPTAEDCGFIRGPVDIVCNDQGRIEGIERSVQTPLEVERINGTGLFATAGFVDSHTHALFAGNRSEEFFRRWRGASYAEQAAAGGGIHSTVRATQQATDEQLCAALAKVLAEGLRAGCTTLEIKSGYGDSAAGEIRLLELIHRVARSVLTPRVSATFLGLHALPQGRPENEYCDEMIAGLPQVAGGKLATQVDSFPEKGFFSLAESLRFSRAAIANGLAVKVHADELTPLGSSEAFIQIGARSVDHLQQINPVAVELLAGSPTVATLLPCTSFFLGQGYADARNLIDRGARVALASDYNPGTSPAIGLQLTLLLAANSLKMTAAEILCAVTSNGAAAVGLESGLGALLPKYQADILLWQTESHSGNAHGTGVFEEIITRCLKPVTVVSDGRLTFYHRP